MPTEFNDDPTAGQSRGISRRTVVRVGANAAWMVPAVSLITAAPAMAVSPIGLALSGFTASYKNGGTSGTMEPNILNVSAILTNTDPHAPAVPARGVQVTLTIPANLYASAPTSTTPALFAAPVISGTYAGGWTLKYLAAAPIANGTAATFDPTITFTDGVDASPYRAWAGTAWALKASATATNGSGAATGTAAVAAAANTTIGIASGPTGATNIQASRFQVTASNRADYPASQYPNLGYYLRLRLVYGVINTGRKTLADQITISVNVPKASATPTFYPYYIGSDNVSPGGGGAGAEGTGVNGYNPDGTSNGVAAGWQRGARTADATTWLQEFKTVTSVRKEVACKESAASTGQINGTSYSPRSTINFRTDIWLSQTTYVAPFTVTVTATGPAGMVTETASTG